LDSQPLAKAIDTLLGKMTAEGNWRRVLHIMECQASMEQTRGGLPGKIKEISAVRSYLAGQNFELAEQWKDAASAYKAVLAAAIEGAPVNESADRLKALSKEHPEEVKAARSFPGPDSLPIFSR
jgi:hypothetical protein